MLKAIRFHKFYDELRFMKTRLKEDNRFHKLFEMHLAATAYLFHILRFVDRKLISFCFRRNNKVESKTYGPLSIHPKLEVFIRNNNRVQITSLKLFISTPRAGPVRQSPLLFSALKLL